MSATWVSPSVEKIPLPELNNASLTLLVPLYLRARESERPDAILRDEKAAEIIRHLDYDFAKLRATSLMQIFPLLRARKFDGCIRAFMAAHPGCTVVDIGCGLDTRFWRVDDGKARWYDLDLPPVMALRQRVMDVPKCCHELGASALDFTWLEQIHGAPVLFVAEGVLPYLQEHEVKWLVRALRDHFPGAEFICDALPPSFKLLNRIQPALRATGAQLNWTLADGHEMESWGNGIRLLEEWSYFDEPEPRLGMLRFFRWLPIIGGGRVVRLRLGKRY
jgi:O-methyltransferase involved in polyketide biosynthesis